METTGRLPPALAQIWRGPPLVLQIMALLLGGLIIAQLVTLFLTLVLPPEPPPAYRLDDIARVLTGGTAETQTRRALQRREQAEAPVMTGPGWLTSERSRQDLAGLVGRDVEDVQLYFYTPLPFAGTAGAPPRLSEAPGPVRRFQTARALRPGIELAGYQVAQAGPGGCAMPGSAGRAMPSGPRTGTPPGGTPRGGSAPGTAGSERAAPPRSPFPADDAGTARGTDRTPRGERAPLPDGAAPGDRAAPRLPGNLPAARAPDARLPEIAPPPAGQLPADAARRAIPAAERAAPVLPGAVRPADNDRLRQEPRGAPVLPDVVTTPGAGGGVTRSQPDAVGSGTAPATGGARAPILRGADSPQRLPVPLPIPMPESERPRAPLPSPFPAEGGVVRDAPAERSLPLPVPAPLTVPAPLSEPTAAPARARPVPPPPVTAIAPAAAPAGPLAAIGGMFGFRPPPPFVEGDFVAALRLDSGNWAVVQPTPEAFPTAWQQRVLLWFAIAFGLVAPLGWIFARRLVRPIAGFAAAAERLGRDPAAPVLALDGPAEVGRAAIAFNRMQSRLRSFVDDRTAMVGAISHDLRTPLTRLRFRLEDVPDEQREGLLGEVEEMEQMISSVLSLIRDAAEPGRRETVDLRSIVEDVVEDAVMIGRDVRLELGEQAPVEVDALGMRRLFANLLENAVKYGERARVRLFTDQNDAVAEVCDEGPGLPEEELERVFQPFYRTSGARKSEIGGVGLGLAVCRSIARAHGGDVNLKRGAQGLIAQVRLPLSHRQAA